MQCKSKSWQSVNYGVGTVCCGDWGNPMLMELYKSVYASMDPYLKMRRTFLALEVMIEKTERDDNGSQVMPKDRQRR